MVSPFIHSDRKRILYDNVQLRIQFFKIGHFPFLVFRPNREGKTEGVQVNQPEQKLLGEILVVKIKNSPEIEERVRNEIKKK